MIEQQKDAVLFNMVAHSLTASHAPRFLISLFVMPPGEHRINIDLENVDSDTNAAWVLISETEAVPRIRLSYSTDFPEADAAGISMPSVWTHILIDGETFREAKTMEETLPASFDYEIDLRSLAAGSTSVEDLCDACAFPLDPTLAGTDPKAPLDSGTTFELKNAL